MHKVDVDVLCKRFKTTVENGLTDDLVAAGIKEHGPNALTPPPTVPEWVKFCKCLFSGFAMLLWLGAILCFVAYGIQVTTKENIKISSELPSIKRHIKTRSRHQKLDAVSHSRPQPTRSPRMTTSTSASSSLLSSPSPASSPIIRSQNSPQSTFTETNHHFVSWNHHNNIDNNITQISSTISHQRSTIFNSGVEIREDHGGFQEPGSTVRSRQKERWRENHCKDLIHQKTKTATKTEEYNDKETIL